MFKSSFKFSCFIVVILSFIQFSASAKIIDKINVLGNERISDETIMMFSGVELNDDLQINDINKILKKIYDTNFFDDVKIYLEVNSLNIQVKEKPIIENITYSGFKSKVINDEIFKSRVLKPRSSFDEITLKQDRDNILYSLKNLGYYFAEIITQIETLEDNKINISYKIDIGEKSKIEKITFIGDKKYKDKKLKSIIISEEYKFWKFISGAKFLKEEIISLDKRLLKNFFLNKGYRDVEINSSFAKLVGKNKFELIYNVDAKNKFFFDNIKLNVSLDFNDDNFFELIKDFEKLKGKPYSIYSIKNIIKKIEKIALSEQFESVVVNPIEDVVSDKINITFNIEETEKFFVEKINIFGNNVTQENVIRNQFELDEGDPFNEILYNRTVNNIKSLGFFKKATGEIQPGINSNSKIINYSVEEKATGEISLGAGAGTQGATIGFGIKENNFLGRGINLNTFATITEETVKGKFSVKNPNFKNSSKSINASIEAVEIDRSTTFGYKTNKAGFTVGTDFEFYDDLNLGLGLTNFYEKISTDATASALQKTQEGNYWDSFLNLDFNYDKRNQTFQPSSGFKSFYSVNIPMVSDTNTFVNSYNYTHYSELYEENVTSASVYIKTANSISGDNIKLSERLFIPSKRLRGFERGKIGPKDGDDFVGGNFVTSANVSSNLPYLLNNLQQVDFIMFLDVANVWGVDYDSSIDDSGSFRSAIGLGVDWATPIGPLNFTFAQPITKESSDITETFRFNLGTTF